MATNGGTVPSPVRKAAYAKTVKAMPGTRMRAQPVRSLAAPMPDKASAGISSTPPEVNPMAARGSGRVPLDGLAAQHRDAGESRAVRHRKHSAEQAVGAQLHGPRQQQPVPHERQHQGEDGAQRRAKPADGPGEGVGEERGRTEADQRREADG